MIITKKMKTKVSKRLESQETIAGQGFEETLNFYNYTQNGKMEDLQLLNKNHDNQWYGSRGGEDTWDYKPWGTLQMVRLSLQHK